MGDSRFRYSVSSNASIKSTREKNRSKIATSTAKALKSTSRLFEVLKDGNIPLVGILDGALKAGAGMLQPEISNEDLSCYLENSFSMIATDLKKIV